MKDETAGVPIIEFVSGGPKNYGYQLQNGDTECKVRGFTLDEQGRALLNFEPMKQHILKEIYDPDEEPFRFLSTPILKKIEPRRKSI